MGSLTSRIGWAAIGALLALPVIMATTHGQNDSTSALHRRIAEGLGLRELISADLRKEFENRVAPKNDGIPEDLLEDFINQLVDSVTTDGIVRTIIAPVLDKYFTAEDQEAFAGFVEKSYGREIVLSNLADPNVDMASIAEGGERSEEESKDIFRLFFIYARAQMNSNGGLATDLILAYATYTLELSDEVFETLREARNSD